MIELRQLRLVARADELEARVEELERRAQELQDRVRELEQLQARSARPWEAESGWTGSR